MNDLVSLQIDVLRDKRLLLKQKELSSRNFFLLLSEYILFLQKLPLFPLIQKQLTADKESDEGEVKRLSKLVLSDIKTVRVKLLSELKKKKIPLDHLNDFHFNRVHPNYNNQNEHFENYESGKSAISGDRIDNLHSIVGQMINGLLLHGHKDIISPYAEFEKYKTEPEKSKGEVYVSKWRISKHYEYYDRAKEILKVKSQVKAWSSYERLILVPFALYDYIPYRDKLVKKFDQGEPVFMEIANLDGIVNEMKNIMEGQDKDVYEFKKDSYLYCCELLTFYIIDFLVKSNFDSKDLQKISGVGISKTQENIRTYLTEKIIWPSGFEWDKEKTNFLLGSKEHSLPFDPGESKRKSVFDELQKKRGDWAIVWEIAEYLNIDEENEVRKIINQLMDKIEEKKLLKHISIEARNDPGQRGAYRLIATPSKKYIQTKLKSSTG